MKELWLKLIDMKFSDCVTDNLMILNYQGLNSMDNRPLWINGYNDFNYIPEVKKEFTRVIVGPKKTPYIISTIEYERAMKENRKVAIETGKKNSDGTGGVVFVNKEKYQQYLKMVNRR